MSHGTTGDDTIRVVLYSHDSQGIGHVRRNLALARMLAEKLPVLTGKQVCGLLISGLSSASVFPLPEGFDWFFIPSIAKGADGYEPRNLGADWSTLRDIRSRAIKGALLGFQPDLVIVDRHIYGVDQELRKPLKKLRKKNPLARVVLGMREVLDSPQVAQAEWQRLGDSAQVDSIIDEVWVYGDRDVHDPVATGEIPGYLADKVRYTGYLSLGRAAAEIHDDVPWDEPFILTCAGGGSDGYRLLAAAAAMPVPEGHQHVVIAGPQMSTSEFDALRAAAGAATHVYRMWPGLAAVMGQAAAVISMGGYNTAAEILATDTPALIVPREVPREEQLIRARALQAVDAVDVMRIDDVSAAALGAWAVGAVGTSVDRGAVDRNGLASVAELVACLVLGFDCDVDGLEFDVEEALEQMVGI